MLQYFWNSTETQEMWQYCCSFSQKVLRPHCRCSFPQKIFQPQYWCSISETILRRRRWAGHDLVPENAWQPTTAAWFCNWIFSCNIFQVLEIFFRYSRYAWQAHWSMNLLFGVHFIFCQDIETPQVVINVHVPLMKSLPKEIVWQKVGEANKSLGWWQLIIIIVIIIIIIILVIQWVPMQKWGVDDSGSSARAHRVCWGGATHKYYTSNVQIPNEYNTNTLKILYKYYTYTNTNANTNTNTNTNTWQICQV